jgi:hypothetical protein
MLGTDLSLLDDQTPVELADLARLDWNEGCQVVAALYHAAGLHQVPQDDSHRPDWPLAPDPIPGPVISGDHVADGRA